MRARKGYPGRPYVVMGGGRVYYSKILVAKWFEDQTQTVGAVTTGGGNDDDG